MGRVRFTSRIKEWEGKTEQDLDKSVLKMALDIHRMSGILAPKLDGGLVKSGRIERNGTASYSIVYGGRGIPYARIQHEGGTIRPKTAERLVWKDRKTGEFRSAKSVTIKGTKYLKKAGDSAKKNINRYI